MKPSSPERSVSAIARSMGAPALVFFVLVLARAVASVTASPECFPTNTCDGLFFRMAAEAITSGRSPYNDDVLREAVFTKLGFEAPFVLPFKYPPAAFPLFMLYLPGTPRMGFFVFTCASALGLGAAIVALARRLELSEAATWLVAIYAAVSGPAVLNVALGQTGFWIAALGIGVAALYEKRPMFAGALLGLCVFKPQYAMFFGVVPLFERRFRLLGVATVVAALVALAGTAMAPPGAWPAFATAIATYNPTTPFMANWLSFVFALAPQHLAAATQLGLAVAALGIFVAGVGVWRLRDTQRRFAWVACTAMLLSPNTHPYDAGLMILPLATFLRGERPFSRSVAIAAVAFAVSIFGLQRRWMFAAAACAAAALILRGAASETPARAVP